MNPLAQGTNDLGHKVERKRSTELRLAQLMKRTRSYAQLLHSTLYAVRQSDQGKPTDANIDFRILVQLTPGLATMLTLGQKENCSRF